MAQVNHQELVKNFAEGEADPIRALVAVGALHLDNVGLLELSEVEATGAVSELLRAGGIESAEVVLVDIMYSNAEATALLDQGVPRDQWPSTAATAESVVDDNSRYVVIDLGDGHFVDMAAALLRDTDAGLDLYQAYVVDEHRPVPLPDWDSTTDIEDDKTVSIRWRRDAQGWKRSVAWRARWETADDMAALISATFELRQAASRTVK